MALFPQTHLFGYYASSPKPYSFAQNGLDGFLSCPAGHYWYQLTDANQQIWCSASPLQIDINGVVFSPTGDVIYAADLNLDGTLVFQSLLTSRVNNWDSPPPDRLSTSN